MGGNVTANASAVQANIFGNLSLGSVTRTFNVVGGIAAIDMLISANISGTGGMIKDCLGTPTRIHSTLGPAPGL